MIFTGNTQPCDSVTELARGADMMLCMRWDDQAVMDANGEYTGRWARPARPAWPMPQGWENWCSFTSGPHLSTHGPMEQGIGDISRIYNGEIVFSGELMRISL